MFSGLSPFNVPDSGLTHGGVSGLSPGILPSASGMFTRGGAQRAFHLRIQYSLPGQGGRAVKSSRGSSLPRSHRLWVTPSKLPLPRLRHADRQPRSVFPLDRRRSASRNTQRSTGLHRARSRHDANRHPQSRPRHDWRRLRGSWSSSAGISADGPQPEQRARDSQLEQIKKRSRCRISTRSSGNHPARHEHRPINNSRPE